MEELVTHTLQMTVKYSAETLPPAYQNNDHQNKMGRFVCQAENRWRFSR
jgi:hypothetical protein